MCKAYPEFMFLSVQMLQCNSMAQKCTCDARRQPEPGAQSRTRLAQRPGPCPPTHPPNHTPTHYSASLPPELPKKHESVKTSRAGCDRYSGMFLGSTMLHYDPRASPCLSWPPRKFAFFMYSWRRLRHCMSMTVGRTNPTKGHLGNARPTHSRNDATLDA